MGASRGKAKMNRRVTSTPRGSRVFHKGGPPCYHLAPAATSTSTSTSLGSSISSMELDTLKTPQTGSSSEATSSPPELTATSN